MHEIDLFYSVSRLLGALGIMFAAHYAWKKSKFSRNMMIVCLPVALVASLPDLFNKKTYLSAPIPERALDVTIWSIIAVTVWLCANYEFSRRWGK
jgi:hypothetical protein